MLLGFCTDTVEIWQFVGKILWIIRVLVPVILLVIGTVTLGKAVIAEDDGEIKKSVTKLVKKVIIAAIIFFLPMLVKAIFNLVLSDEAKGNAQNDYVVCIDSLL